MTNNDDWNIKGRLVLSEALKNGLPDSTCYVYRISIPAHGCSTYIGFTTQNPRSRLEQHLESAKTDSKNKVHKELRKFGFLHEFEVISSYANEVLGLVGEIVNIQKYNAGLNSTKGGEGNNYNVVEDRNHLGEQVFYVENKQVAKRNAEIKKISNRLQEKDSFEYTHSLNKKIDFRYKSVINTTGIEGKILEKMFPFGDDWKKIYNSFDSVYRSLPYGGCTFDKDHNEIMAARKTFLKTRLNTLRERRAAVKEKNPTSGSYLEKVSEAVKLIKDNHLYVCDKSQTISHEGFFFYDGLYGKQFKSFGRKGVFSDGKPRFSNFYNMVLLGDPRFAFKDENTAKDFVTSMYRIIPEVVDPKTGFYLPLKRRFSKKLTYEKLRVDSSGRVTKF